MEKLKEARLDIPLPVRIANKLLTSSSRPVLVAGAAVFLPLFLISTLSGAIYPNESVPIWGANPLEATGLFLMLAILPAYLLMCFVGLTRTNNATFEVVDSLLPDCDVAEIRYKNAAWWPLSAVVALAFGFFGNIVWSGISFDVSDPLFAVSISIVLGQLTLWLIVGVVVHLGIQEGLVFRKIGKIVPIDIYNLDELNGFGQASLNSFLMIVGALAITALQSLDQVFRIENYLNAFLVCIPAILILVPMPIWSLHRRILKHKSELLNEIAAEIKSSSHALSGEEFHNMNALLSRKEKIQHTRNWPMDLSMGARFILYIFIPPLAWTGAALMEVFLDSLLVG